MKYFAKKLICISISGFALAQAISAQADKNDGQALLSAISAENIEGYSSVMSRLLTQRNVNQFKNALYKSQTAEGDNIFHLMAKVRQDSARLFFAKEMQTLLRLFKGDLKSGDSLGGTKILIPPFAKLPISQAFPAQEQNSAFLSAFPRAKDNPALINDMLPPSIDLPVLKREAKRLSEGPVIELIKALYAENNLGRRFFRDFIFLASDPENKNLIQQFDNFRLSIDALSASAANLESLREEENRMRENFFKQMNEVSNGLLLSSSVIMDLKEINNYEGFLERILQPANSQFRTPLDTAIHAQNTQAYHLLKNYRWRPRSRDLSPLIYSTGLLSFSAGWAGLTGYRIYETINHEQWPWPPLYALSPVENLGVALGAGLAGMGAHKACREVIKRWNIYRMLKSSSRPSPAQ